MNSFLHRGMCGHKNYTDLHCKPNTGWFSFCFVSWIWSLLSTHHPTHSPTQNGNTGNDDCPMHVSMHASVRPTSDWRSLSPTFPLWCGVLCCASNMSLPPKDNWNHPLRPLTDQAEIHAGKKNVLSKPTMQVRTSHSFIWVRQRAFSSVQVRGSHRPTPQGTPHVTTLEVDPEASISSAHHKEHHRSCTHWRPQLQSPI